MPLKIDAAFMPCILEGGAISREDMLAVAVLAASISMCRNLCRRSLRGWAYFSGANFVRGFSAEAARMNSEFAACICAPSPSGSICACAKRVFDAQLLACWCIV